MWRANTHCVEHANMLSIFIEHRYVPNKGGTYHTFVLLLDISSVSTFDKTIELGDILIFYI